jgi:antitoxin HicB
MSAALTYPANAVLEAQNEWTLVIPDVPEAVFGADTEAELWRDAPNVLALALLSYPRSRQPFPSASATLANARLVSVPAVQSAKLFIHRAMAARGMTAADLARLLDTDHKSVRRILSLAHNTRMDQLEQVLAALDVRVVLMAA